MMSYNLSEENITVQTLPNAYNPPSMDACATPRRETILVTNAMSKVYKFSPSGPTEHRVMCVIDLFDSHNFDYNNMTVMCKRDEDRDFRQADSLKDDKPIWLFYRNTCYLFLDHFSWVYVANKCSREGIFMPIFRCCCPEKINGPKVVESLLFSKKCDGKIDLKLTFGCYRKKCRFFYQNVIKVCFHFHRKNSV